MRTNGRRGMFVLIVVLSMSTVSHVVGGGPVGDAAAAGSDIKIISMDVPDEMEPGENYDTQVKYRNAGDSTGQVRVQYVFDGQGVVSFEEIIDAGETKTASLRISLSDAANSEPGKLYDGTYEHGYRIGDTQTQREVTVDGLGTPTPTSTPIPQETVGDGPSDSPSSATGIRILASDFPEQLGWDERIIGAVQLENSGSSTQQLDVIYFLQGESTVGTRMTLEPGEVRTATIPISRRDVDDGFPGTIQPGTYRWEVRAGDASRSGRITIDQDSGDGSASSGEFSDGAETPVGGADARPRRGFFTNGGAQVGFLDSFTLTIGGFVLSAFGIVYQMVRG